MSRCRAVLSLALVGALVVPLAFGGRAAADSSPEHRLEAAIQAKDAAAAKVAIEDLAEKDDEPSAHAILHWCGKAAGVLDLEEVAANALAGMKSDGAKKVLFRTLKGDELEPSRFLAMVAAARMKLPEAFEALLNAITDKDAFIAGGAIRELKHNATRDVVGKMIDKLAAIQKDKKYAAARRELVSALRDVTDKDLEDAQDWKNWWATNGETFDPKKADKGGKKGDDVVSRLRENHPADAKTVERLSKDDIVIVHVRQDRCEEILGALKLPFVKIEDKAFAGFPLEPRQILIYSCNGAAEAPSDDEIKKIQKFVSEGGYLFTSDWELKPIIQKAFPGKLTFTHQTGAENEVHIRLAQGPGAQHPYNRDVFPMDPFKRANFMWKVHERSHLFKVGEGVTVLVEANESEMNAGDKEKKDKEDDDPPQGKHRGRRKHPPGGGGGAEPQNGDIVPVAVTFRYGSSSVQKKGRVESGGHHPEGGEHSGERDLVGGAVLHVTSHFRDQKSADGDGFALQQLLLNFIVEKQKANVAGK